MGLAEYLNRILQLLKYYWKKVNSLYMASFFGTFIVN